MKNPVGQKSVELVKKQLEGMEGTGVYNIQVKMARSQGGRHQRRGSDFVVEEWEPTLRGGYGMEPLSPASPNNATPAWAVDRLGRTGFRVARTKR